MTVRRGIFYSAIAVVLFFWTIPLLALLGRLDWARVPELWQRVEVQAAIRLSLTTSLVATIIAVIIGLPLAWFLAERQETRWRHCELVLDISMVLPPTVLGLALLMALGRTSWLGQTLSILGWQLPFTTAAVVVAQIFVAGPFLIKCALGSFTQVSKEMQEAASVMGANSLRVFFTITLPLAWSGIVTGILTCWARALGEFGATLLFAGNFPGRTQTMPLAIYQFMEQDLQAALCLSVLLLGTACLVLVFLREKFSLWRRI
jgi:molybdate transport system permease protein